MDLLFIHTTLLTFTGIEDLCDVGLLLKSTQKQCASRVTASCVHMGHAYFFHDAERIKLLLVIFFSSVAHSPYHAKWRNISFEYTLWASFENIINIPDLYINHRSTKQCFSYFSKNANSWHTYIFVCNFIRTEVFAAWCSHFVTDWHKM